MTKTPLVLFSDGPHLPTGLARITRDLAARLWEDRDRLGVDLLQVGWDPKAGPAMDWPTYQLSQLHSEGDWGAAELREVWGDYWGHAEGILFTVWDAARAFSLLGLQDSRTLWGYFPVDGVNVHGSIGGPARQAIGGYDRVLAYGRWGSQALGRIRRPVSYLPHGLDLGVWTLGHHQDTLAQAERVMRPREGSWILGCVATNQIRKDLGLYFATLAELKRRGEKVRGWLHTDLPTRAWSVAQLAEDFGLEKSVSVSLSLDDQTLAACYSLCGATFAPGLGEGFGYPIVESLACGTPVVHCDYAGGRELVPLNAWRVPYGAERLEGCYGIKRPVMSAEDVANAVLRAVEWKRNDHQVCQQYCRGSVEHLGWDRIWPRWRSWFKQGLEAFNG
jgi:glycosyltransferase involved in cell wall biosynthesis